MAMTTGATGSGTLVGATVAGRSTLAAVEGGSLLGSRVLLMGIVSLLLTLLGSSFVGLDEPIPLLKLLLGLLFSGTSAIDGDRLSLDVGLPLVLPALDSAGEGAWELFENEAAREGVLPNSTEAGLMPAT